MGFFKKKPDPISERARALSDEINALEAEIKKLSSKAAEEPVPPKWRSTAVPDPTAHPAPSLPPVMREPVFEESNASKSSTDSPTTPDHYNDLGVRKYDLAAAWRRLKNHFHGPPVNNPRLVNYLAAGSIQGLRPLRYEKRVARNRTLVFTAILVLVLVGIFVALSKR